MLSYLTSTVQHGDWKNEKHVPVIKVPQRVSKGESFEVTVCIGEEIPHPNTFEHHIQWVKVFFKPENGKFPIEVFSSNFTSHGESDVFTDYKSTFSFKSEVSGDLYALSFCNIHGLWENEVNLVCK